MTAPPLRQQDLIPEMVRWVPAVGQSNPSATTATTLYTCPVQRFVRGRVLVANLSTATTFRLALRPLAAALANAHYIVYEAPISAGETLHTVELFLSPTDVLTVYAGSANMSFTFNGYSEPKDT